MLGDQPSLRRLPRRLPKQVRGHIGGRAEQRKRYDQRKRETATEHGYTLVPIPWSRGQKRQRHPDLEQLRRLLADAGVELAPLPGP